LQLHAKFDRLKKDHTDEKNKLDDHRRKLEEEMVEYNRRKSQLQSGSHTLTLGKSKKK
jgi:septin 6/8/11